MKSKSLLCLKLTYFLLISVLVNFSWINCAQAQVTTSRLIEKTLELETDEENPTLAKKYLIEKITEKISEKLIKDIIGESKYNRNGVLIQNKIIKMSARFIPVSKTSELKPLPTGGFKLALTLKVSQDDLQSMLLENGLFYESDSTPLLLPVIVFTDKVNGKVYGWWKDDEKNKSELIKYTAHIENTLKVVFAKNGFYVLRPQILKYTSLIPLLESKNMDWDSKAQDLNAQILLQGEVIISKSKIRSESYQLYIKITANQVQNGRSIAEVVRTYETDAGVFNFVIEKKLKENMETVATDLSSQVLEAWQKGTIGANLYKLSLNGNMPIQFHETLKTTLRDKIKEIKNIKERLISSERVTFEVDTSLTPKDLKIKLPKWTIPGYVMTADQVSDQEIQYRVEKEGTMK